jgi:nitroreductase
LIWYFLCRKVRIFWGFLAKPIIFCVSLDNQKTKQMADDYIGKKMEEYMARKGTPMPKRKTATSLGQLLLKNRSHRAYDHSFVVRADQLRSIIEVNTKIPSARNRQPLRFRAVGEEEAAAVLPHIRMGGALPELNLPAEGTEPRAFIVVCSVVPEDRYVSIDLGISAQSMLLRATEMGLNGCCIAAFDQQAVQQALGLELTPLLVVAIGKGADTIRLTEITPDDSRAYYRAEGVHYVPKLQLDDLIITKTTD